MCWLLLLLLFKPNHKPKLFIILLAQSAPTTPTRGHAADAEAEESSVPPQSPSLKELDDLHYAPQQVHPCVIPCLVGYSPDGYPAALSGSNGNTPSVSLARDIMKRGLTGGDIHDTHMHVFLARKVPDTVFAKWNDPTVEENKNISDSGTGYVSKYWVFGIWENSPFHKPTCVNYCVRGIRWHLMSLTLPFCLTLTLIWNLGIFLIYTHTLTWCLLPLPLINTEIWLPCKMLEYQ